MPPLIAVLIQNKMGTLREFQEYYGLKDAYDLLECLAVDNNNRMTLANDSKNR
jgi:hypothetical protein